MQLQLTRLFQAGNLPEDAIPYSLAALRQDLERVRNAWDDCQGSRDRNAIYGYLKAVYGLMAWWTAEGQETERSRRALRSRCLDASNREDPFAAVIRCTAALARADKRTKIEESRLMRYRVVNKPVSEPLDQFVRPCLHSSFLPAGWAIVELLPPAFATEYLMLTRRRRIHPA